MLSRAAAARDVAAYGERRLRAPLALALARVQRAYRGVSGRLGGRFVSDLEEFVVDLMRGWMVAFELSGCGRGRFASEFGGSLVGRLAGRLDRKLKRWVSYNVRDRKLLR